MSNKVYTIKMVERWLNALEVFGIFVLLGLAFSFQFILRELPCPLCLLQRIGFLITSIGFLMNLRFGLRASHYALSLLGALFTAFVALRQIALHIVPGTGSFGPAILSLHMYTWSFIISMAIVIFTTLILSIDIQYEKPKNTPHHFKPIVHALFTLILIMTALNFISVLFQCGIHQCPEDPSHYLWWQKLLNMFS